MTKLYIPPPRPRIVKRDRLIEQLNAGLHRKLTLITAPAGFGKTTIVVDWITQCPYPAAWLSIDEQDSDTTRFLSYIIAALQTIKPQLSEALEHALQSPQLAMESLLTTLLNEIATMPEPFILVLDDYHVLDNPSIDHALAFLLEHLPPQLHLVMTTREDPALPLSRLRARGQLTELRSSDLRFTPDEAVEFLNSVMDLKLTPQDVRALETRTEGWITGLQLAALSMQGQNDVQGFITAFTGDNRYIVDYLVDEVLRHQPQHIRDFLLQTSILDRLSESLCSAVTHQQEAGTLLQAMERDNLFVIPLDDKRIWFRYHHLFADVLHAHLMHEQPQLLAELHRRASDWYEQNNWTSDAIRHALAAHDYERAVDLVEMAWPPMFKGFHPATWLGWVKALPEGLIQSRPVLNLGATWTLLHEGELESADVHLRNTQRWLDAPTPDMVVINEPALKTLPALVANARIYLAQAQGDHSATLNYGQQTLDVLALDDHYHRGLVELFTGYAHWSNGELETACEAINRSVAYMQLANNAYFEVVGLTALADIMVVQGQLHQAERAYQQVVQMGIESKSFVLQKLSDRFVNLSKLYLERNDLQSAIHYMQEGEKELVEQAIFPGRDARWYTAMAGIKLVQGNPNGAFEQVLKAERFYQRDAFPDLYPIKAEKARICIVAGDLNDALKWAREQGLSVEDDLSYRREFEYITLARLLIALYRGGNNSAINDAHHLLERLLHHAESGGRNTSVIEILILQALAHEAQDNLPQAFDPLQRALSLAEPEGFVRSFLDEGAPMQRLLSGMKQGESKDYINRLLTVFRAEISPDFAEPASQPLIDPLSERELEVLQLIADGLSNREIGERLFLALNTVKGHNRHIFSKLGVQRRTEAIARSRELGILSD